MSLQVFLQAKLLGIEEFLAIHQTGHPDDTTALIGRCAWLGLLCEVLPRALLAELKLSRMLLGSSSAEQFLLVLTDETIPVANQFLNRAATAIAQLSSHSLRLVWASTENLGAWPIARKRLDDALTAKIAAPLMDTEQVAELFVPFAETETSNGDTYFLDFGQQLPQATKVGWSREEPARLVWDQGAYSWTLKDQSGLDDDAILFPRRFAQEESEAKPASLAEIARRSDGAPKWAILRGDIDHFDLRLRRSASIEEHIHLSILFKEFFAGELSVLCTLPDFWRKVSILFRGGDDFAVIGSWDSLLLLARELQRLFDRFVEQNLANFAGLEGKTLTMALAIASEPETSAASVFEEAEMELRAAKAADVGTFHLFGRTLEWKRLPDAEELKNGLVRLVKEFRFPPAYINDLTAVYREAFSARATKRNKAIRLDKPWRTHMQLSRIIPMARGKEFNNLRSTLIANLVGRKTAGFKLRPSARVGLEWARLAAGS